MKLKTVALQSRLRLTALATRIRVVVGDFISALLPEDNFFVSEIFTKQAGKNILENLQFTDTSLVVLNKSTPEIITIGDGTAEPYFAEDYVVGAPTNQTYTLSGGFYWSLLKSPQESIVISDGIFDKHFSKNLSDGIVVTEHISGVSPLDELIDDTPAVADIRVIAFSKNTSDAANFIDSRITNFGKRPSNTATASDNINSFNVSKVLLDTAATSDNVVIVNSFSRVASDTSSVNDSVIYRNVSKVVSEVAVISSSGNLRMQNYTVDMTYFAEDYVGSSLAFS